MMDAKTILTTPRLLLREMTDGDAPALAAILQDSRVMTAYEHTFSDQDVEKWLHRQQGRYLRDGFGLWAVVLKETGQMIGQAGLTWQEVEQEKVLEVGYLLRYDCWGKGYATEAASACRDYAFSRLGAKAVFSIIKADNFPSQRVAQRLGMKKVKTFMTGFYSEPREHFLFGIENPNLR